MVFSAPVLALVLVAVFVGAVLQRLSGTGMGLVLAPILAVVLGAGTGVLVANATTTVSALMMLVALWRDVEWRRALLICGFAVPGAVVGGFVVRATPAAWLQVIVGGVVMLAILVTVLASALVRMPRVRAPWITPLAGFLGGIFNTTAGVSAPVMVVHSRLVRWEQKAFAASMQPVFAAMGFFSVLVKSLMAAADTALPPWWLLPVVVVTVVLGIQAGGWAARRVSSAQARTVAITLAGLGGLSALVRGVLALV
ncbi:MULTISPECIES: sulfite exporter TauE/SafE family protein [unclassified Luteococcus]|uniref:sulfite exporter TauE/SafE family protein n=1 Tax=unclassified Luteococcus TaxID=2639923 RepID=UPI00313F0B96